jgi:AcrR family transcriptional regulator
MLSAAVDIAARDGYEATTIDRIIAQAGVSRPTFYDYFTNKDACLLATITMVNRHVLAQVQKRVSAQPPARAVHATIETIFELCVEHPTMARVLLDASLAGPPEVLDARSDGIAAVARTIDDAHRAVPAQALVPDIGSSVLIAGILCLLGASLRRDEVPDLAMLEAVLSWVDSYAVPATERRWATLRIPSPIEPRSVMLEPPFGTPPLAAKHDFPGGQAEHARQRLLFAAGAASDNKGFSAATLTDITRSAGVSYRIFRRLFSTKEGLFMALHEVGYRRALAVSFRGYLSSRTWPERVWTAGQAYTEFVASNPTIAHVGFVDSYAAGPHAALRMDKTLKAFTLFLADGDAYLAAGRERPPQIALDAIAATIFDLGSRHCRAGKGAELPDLLPQAIYIALTPFLGPQDSVRFLDSKVDTRQDTAA